jgi:esterase/lipase superfamily enzyme
MLALDDIQVGALIVFFDGDQIHLFVLTAIHDIVWIKVVSAFSRDKRMHQAHERYIYVYVQLAR